MPASDETPKDLVRRGYDVISSAYRGDQETEQEAQYHAWLDELLAQLPAHPDVLDLGCGNGVPVARRLAKNTRFTGVDFSQVQIERARKLVPGARFLQADMSSLAFPALSFDAVLAFYSIIHLPLEEQPGLFRNISTWLRPGGIFLGTLGAAWWTGQEEDWLGAAMYWSHADEPTYRRWLGQAGFQVLWTRFIPEGAGGHTLLQARKSG